MTIFKGSPLGELPRIRNVRTRRASSWDQTGGNDDNIKIQPGQTVVLADIEGAGCINHIWCTHFCPQPDYLRRIILRMKWDNESDYSVIEDPIHFQKSIRVTIEHGHANRRSDDYSSTAYWYQLESHKPFPSLPPVKDRLPRGEE
jgi:hypothetical protein